MPELSVIVPVYNTQNYLRECIDSILNQSFADFELILIDDGSTDESPNICDAYAAEDGRVNVLHQKNQGQSSARNNGVAAANTDLICFIDSDDTVNSGLLELFFKAYRANDVSAVVCDRICGSAPPADFYLPKEPATQLLAIDEETLCELLQKNDTLYWTLFPCLIRKSIYEACPLTPGRVMEDNAVAPQWLTAAKRIAVLRAPLYFYRENPTGTMHADLSEKNLDFFWALEQQLAFCEKQGFGKLQGAVAREYVLSARYVAKRFQTENHDRATARRVIKSAVQIQKKYKNSISLTEAETAKLFQAAHPVLHRVRKKMQTHISQIITGNGGIIMSTSTKQENRILYFDALRVFACIAVIVLHVAAQKFDKVDVGSFEWTVFNVYDSLVRWAVPVFVMLSGALFLNPDKQIDIRKLYTNNILHVATAFVFWSACYALEDYFEGVRLRTVAFNFVNGGVHLWFLYLIAGLYIVVPLLRKLTESEKLTNYFLVLWFAFSVLVPTAKGFIALINDRFVGWLEVVYSEMGVNLVCGFTGYYMLGHWLHQHTLTKKQRAAIYALGVCGAAMTVLFTYLISKKRGYFDDTFYNAMSVFVMLEAAAVFTFFKYCTPQFKNGTVRNLLLTCSDCVLGVYLVHMFFVDHSRTIFRMHTLTINPILSVPLITGGVFVCSLIVSWILNRIPLIRKYLV